jgi:integrase/recombinase XerD
MPSACGSSKRATRRSAANSQNAVEHRVLPLLNDGQMRALIGYRPHTVRQWRTHTAVLFILDTGLRISEALNLRHADVSADNLILKVFGKGQKERLVPFSPELRKRLYRFEQLKTKKDIRSESLFAGFGGSQWEKRNSSHALHLLQHKLGLPRFGWHRLRHTFATNYLRHGGDVVRLSMVLGHTQITTTQRYLHLLTEDLSASHQKVSILNRLG